MDIKVKSDEELKKLSLTELFKENGNAREEAAFVKAASVHSQTPDEDVEKAKKWLEYAERVKGVFSEKVEQVETKIEKRL